MKTYKCYDREKTKDIYQFSSKDRNTFISLPFWGRNICPFAQFHFHAFLAKMIDQRHLQPHDGTLTLGAPFTASVSINTK